MTSTLENVCDFTLRRAPKDIPSATLANASLLLLDTLGIAAASVVLDSGRIARDVASCLYAAGSDEYRARMLFDGRSLSLAGAVYAAATQIDNLDGHDGYNPTKGHIGVVTVPTLSALAEAAPKLTGPDALAALVVGYEVAGRAGIALHATVSDYHTSGAWNALGVAAMGARMRNHSDEQLRQALGIAEYHGPRSQMMREINNPTMLHDGSGWGAMVGLSATILAEQGFEGAPAITLEAPEVASHWADLGSFWQVDHQYIKPYPICRWAHASIDATRALQMTHKFSAGDIEHIQLNCFHEAAQLYATMPEDTSKAQYSLPFAVATMAAHGTISTQHITGEGLSDPVVAGLVARTSVSESERHSERFPLGRWSDIQITLKDGRVLDSGDVHARGGPEDPVTPDQIRDKFMEFAIPAIGEQRAQKIREGVERLLEPNSRFADFAELLYEPAVCQEQRRSA